MTPGQLEILLRQFSTATGLKILQALIQALGGATQLTMNVALDNRPSWCKRRTSYGVS